MKVVNKPWGYEQWIVTGDKYVLKKIFMWKGCKTSRHYHKRKDETIWFFDGKGVIVLGNGGNPPGDIKYADTERLIGHGDVFHICPLQVHRVYAIEDLTMIEVSTPEVDDVIRLEDDTNRPNGRIESEHKS